MTSVFNNFVSANKRDDLVPAPLARSVISLVRNIKAAVQSSGLANAITLLKAHALETDNPHEDTLEELGGEITADLYTFYTTSFAADPENAGQTPMTLAAFTAWISDPIIFTELVRRIVLDSYLYDDGVGAVTTPLYGVSDISAATAPLQPSYFVSYSMPDLYTTSAGDNLVAKTLPDQANAITIGVSITTPLIPDPQVLYTYSVSLLNSVNSGFVLNMTAPGDPSSGPNGLQVQPLVVGYPPPSSIISTGSDFDQTGVLNFSPFTAATTEMSAVLVIDGNQLSIYYALNSVIQKVTVSSEFNIFVFPINSLVMTPTWNQKDSSSAGIKSLVVYTGAFTDDEVSNLFQSL